MAKTYTSKATAKGGQWTKRQPNWQKQRDDARRVKTLVRGSF